MDFLIKAGRDMLGMTQSELCEKAGIPLITLRRIEGRPTHEGIVSQATIQKVIAALEAEGVEFLKAGEFVENLGAALRAVDCESTQRQSFGTWEPVANESAAVAALRSLWVYQPQGNGTDRIWVACDVEQLVVIGEALLKDGEWMVRTRPLVFKPLRCAEGRIAST